MFIHCYLEGNIKKVLDYSVEDSKKSLFFIVLAKKRLKLIRNGR